MQAVGLCNLPFVDRRCNIQNFSMRTGCTALWFGLMPDQQKWAWLHDMHVMGSCLRHSSLYF